MGARKGRALLFVLTIFVLYVAARELYSADKTSVDPSRDSILHIVTQIQRADYESDRPAVKRLHDELTPIPEDNKLASRVLYWRGFALWRSAINGFNETPTPRDLEEDLTGLSLTKQPPEEDSWQSRQGDISQKRKHP